MAPRRFAHQSLFLAVALFGLSACSSFNSLSEAGKIDYRSASKPQSKSLEVPPDLTQLRRDNRYSIPEAAGGSATASSLGQQGGQVAAASAGASVAPKMMADMRIERNGNQRYLVIKQTPELLWPQLKDFWQELGFLINIDEPQTGVMETDWAENRAKIPQDLLRNTIGKLLDSLYSTSERDKFRTRLERGANGTTEIYISHRGAQEVVTGTQNDGTAWTSRNSDPELEALFLSRLMVRLGSDNAVAQAAVGKPVVAAARSKLIKTADAQSVEVDEEFERAWRRVGLALDRVGFTVEDRDRTLGLYFVRYLDDNTGASGAQGFFARLFTYEGGDKSKAAKYRISVKGTGNASKIIVLNEEGKADNSSTANKILTLLNDQLK